MPVPKPVQPVPMSVQPVQPMQPVVELQPLQERQEVAVCPEPLLQGRRWCKLKDQVLDQVMKKLPVPTK